MDPGAIKIIQWSARCSHQRAWCADLATRSCFSQHSIYPRTSVPWYISTSKRRHHTTFSESIQPQHLQSLTDFAIQESTRTMNVNFVVSLVFGVLGFASACLIEDADTPLFHGPIQRVISYNGNEGCGDWQYIPDRRENFCNDTRIRILAWTSDAADKKPQAVPELYMVVGSVNRP